MDDRKEMTKLLFFRIALGFAVFYVAATLIVQFIPQPGKISGPLFSIGEFVAVGYGISILASVMALFFWRSCKHAWTPFLVSALTLAFLYFFWYVKVPTDARIFNDNGGVFYYHTKLELPLRTSSLKEYDSVDHLSSATAPPNYLSKSVKKTFITGLLRTVLIGRRAPTMKTDLL